MKTLFCNVASTFCMCALACLAVQTAWSADNTLTCDAEFGLKNFSETKSEKNALVGICTKGKFIKLSDSQFEELIGRYYAKAAPGQVETKTQVLKDVLLSYRTNSGSSKFTKEENDFVNEMISVVGNLKPKY